jgi:thiol:disulfide interchange protein DsbD
VLARFARPTTGFLAVSAVLALFGLLLGAVHKSFEGAPLGTKLSKGVGLLLTAAGAFAFLMGFIKPDRSLAWEDSGAHAPGALTLTETALQKAMREARPLLVDFTAAWCAACKEIDKLTFTDERVRREAGRFVAVKVDATDTEDPLVDATMDAHKVVGLPTVILFDSSGGEARRFTDFMHADELLAALEKVD